MSKGSHVEDAFAAQLDEHGIPYARQVKAIEGRRFAIDFIVDGCIAVEIQGGVFSGGRHVRGAGYSSDCEKMALLVTGGLVPLWFTTSQVNSGFALLMTARALNRINPSVKSSALLGALESSLGDVKGTPSTASKKKKKARV